MVRIASYNVENLFQRPNAFDTSDWDAGRPILDAYQKVNALFQNTSYTATDKRKMLDLLVKLEIYYKNGDGAIRRKDSPNPKWAWLRKNRGGFDRQPKDSTKDVEIIAGGRSAWNGWVELATEPVDEKATQMTARVIQDVNADILGLVEVEDRPALVRFNKQMIQQPYEHVMLIDGNDERGIDVAIAMRNGFDIVSIRSNVDTKDTKGIVFSRDCAQYEVRTPNGTRIHVLVNHFKSKIGGGGPKRLRQAVQVREIVDDLVAANEHVVVLGDFNEGPRKNGTPANNLLPLLDSQGPLVDCYSLPGFQMGGRPGSYDTCAMSERIDYILLSKSLEPFFVTGEVFRKGLWGQGDKRPTNWATYPEITNGAEQASDHAAVWVQLNI